MSERSIRHTIPPQETSDGAGVRLKRAITWNTHPEIDPWLMMDHFSSDDPEDYIAGFPAHPHRGFETVTYIVDGHMLHEDHLGNRGDLQTGGVQWMTAGRGIEHSEMPQQKDGLLRGFQIWLNLPSDEKMKPAGYRDITADEIPRIDLATGGQVRLIAGDVELEGQSHKGPGESDATRPFIADVLLRPNEKMVLPLPEDDASLFYVFEGEVSVGENRVPTHNTALLNPGETLTLQAGRNGGRVLLLAARPLGESVVQYGPFVMNTSAEIEQALRDYRSGALTAG
jgi:redox-sensitive bicupin YhaK (pirin superfamily)